MEDLLTALGGVASGGTVGIFSFLAGAIAKVGSTVLTMVDRARDRQHELDMLRLNGDLAAKADERKMQELSLTAATERYTADRAVYSAEIGAMVQGNTMQMSMLEHGGRFMANLTVSVRPMVTYMLLFFYLSAKATQVWMSMSLNGEPAVLALSRVHTELDTVLLCTVIGFWFMDRSISRQQARA